MGYLNLLYHTTYSKRTNAIKKKSSRCLSFGDNVETDSPSNSDGFEEVMIYSQESPKSGETFRDFDWANFLFLKIS